MLFYQNISQSAISKLSSSNGRTMRESPTKISQWTMGESNSRLPDANRMHCHYANGPENNSKIKTRFNKRIP
jgi:hypothetical protein